MLTIWLHGPLVMRGADGLDLTPRGSRKLLGLVAYLATAPRLRRPRSDICALLWSDRSPQQQSGSLRQALSALRKALGPYGQALRCDRHSAGFDPDLVHVPEASGPAFLDGLDVGDPAFRTWLRLQRHERRQDPVSPLDPQDDNRIRVDVPTVIILRATDLHPMAAMVTDMFSDILGRSLTEQFSVDVTTAGPAAGGTRAAGRDPSAFCFSTEAMVAATHIAFRVALEIGPRRRRVWFGHRVTDAPMGPDTLNHDEIQRLVNEAVDSYAEALLTSNGAGPDRLGASVMGRLGVRQMFTMRPEAMALADDWFDRAFCLDPRGLYLAWRVMLRIIQLVERHPVDAPAVSAQAIELSRRALEYEPLNSMVVAAASNVASLIETNPHAAVELAQRAVRLNKTNPFGWDGLSTAALHVGRLEEAHVFAVKAQRLAGDTPFKHWYDMGRALTATVTGRLEEALSLAGAASVVPHFKPPLRYLAALHAHEGQALAARTALDRLVALEPDFTPEMIEADPDYPVAGLRRSAILRRGLFGDLT